MTGTNEGLTESDVARLEDSLRRHLVQLRKALTDPERDKADLQFSVAGQLRALLLDRELPILLTYAAHKNIELRVWGPYPPGYRGTPGMVEFAHSALIAWPTPVADGYEMSATEYLDASIGAVVVPDSTRPSGQRSLWYTPRDLIKWVANKEGVAHLQLKPHEPLEAVKDAIKVVGLVDSPGLGVFGANDAFIVRHAILQIGLWTAAAIERTLAGTSSSGSATA